MFEREGAHFLLVRGGGKGLEREAVEDEESTPANVEYNTNTTMCSSGKELKRGNVASDDQSLCSSS